MTAVKKSFERALGQNAAKLYCIKTEGKNSNLSYLVSLKSSQIIRGGVSTLWMAANVSN